MSDSEGFDLDDEILELAGEGEKKRKARRSAAKASKRRRHECVQLLLLNQLEILNLGSTDMSESEGEALEPESEEDEDANPYPLEGKYKDEEDRERYVSIVGRVLIIYSEKDGDRLLEMPEIDREEILAGRLEEMQRLQDKRNLDAMLRIQKGQNDLDDSVAKSAKRGLSSSSVMYETELKEKAGPHAGRSNKEKDRKLDELKARRKAKTDKKFSVCVFYLVLRS
jgi:RNA polymerase-associated protein RTF1